MHHRANHREPGSGAGSRSRRCQETPALEGCQAPGLLRNIMAIRVIDKTKISGTPENRDCAFRHCLTGSGGVTPDCNGTKAMTALAAVKYSTKEGSPQPRFCRFLADLIYTLFATL